jgi:ABC-type multidrug transport system fused ATPase/permease subunit
MYVEKIYPDLRCLYKEAGLPFPEDLPNEDQTFGAYKVSATENTSKQLDQNRYDSLDETSEILRERKVYNATRQQNILQLLKNNKTSAAIYLSLLVAFTIGAVVGTPLLAIGAVLNAALLASIIAYSTIKMLNYQNTGLQNMGIEILLAGIRDNIPTDYISLEDNDELVDILDSTISSLSTLIVMDITAQCNKSKNTTNKSLSIDTEEALLRKKLKEFANKVFNNPDLTEHLYNLGFDVEAVKQDAYSYIKNLTIPQISKTIFGK